MIITGQAAQLIDFMGWSRYDEHVKSWRWQKYLNSQVSDLEEIRRELRL